MASEAQQDGYSWSTKWVTMPRNLLYLVYCVFLKAFAIYFAVVMIRDGFGKSTWWIHLLFWSCMLGWVIFATETTTSTKKSAEIPQEPCAECNGTGSVMISEWDSDFDGNQWPVHYESQCPDCAGSGRK